MSRYPTAILSHCFLVNVHQIIPKTSSIILVLVIRHVPYPALPYFFSNHFEFAQIRNLSIDPHNLDKSQKYRPPLPSPITIRYHRLHSRRRCTSFSPEIVIPCRDKMYRGEKKGLQILLSYSQAVSGRTAKQEQERISPNHVPTIFHFSVCSSVWSFVYVSLTNKSPSFSK